MGRTINRTHRSMLEDSYYSGSSSPAVFNPATLALTGWWRADYSAAPWVGTASSGSSGSGSNNLGDSGVNPVPGTALNGHIPADFTLNGLLQPDKSFLADGTLDTYVNANAGSIWVLFNARTAFTDLGTSYTSPAFFNDGAGTFFSLSFSSTGLTLAIYDGAYETKTVACATGGWHLAQARWDGAHLELTVDSVAWATPTVAGSIGSLTGRPTPGLSGGGVHSFDGLIAEMGTIDSKLTDQNFLDIKSYINSRYGLSL